MSGTPDMNGQMPAEAVPGAMGSTALGMKFPLLGFTKRERATLTIMHALISSGGSTHEVEQVACAVVDRWLAQMRNPPDLNPEPGDSLKV